MAKAWKLVGVFLRGFSMGLFPFSHLYFILDLDESFPILFLFIFVYSGSCILGEVTE
jgi:hypothetical protein